MKYTLLHHYKGSVTKVMSSSNKKQLQEEINNRKGLTRSLGVDDAQVTYTIKKN
jgi:hypothetical protein